MSEKVRVIRVDDFIAERLENEAAKIPPSDAERAKVLLESARLFRESSSIKMVRVSEVVSE